MMEINPNLIDMSPAVIRSLGAMFPALYERAAMPAIIGRDTDANRRSIRFSAGFTAAVNGVVLYFPPAALDMNSAASWDTTTPTDYTVAASRAGKDFYVYATRSGRLVISASSIVPAGYAVADTRRVAGFHCLCVAVGAISGHSLTGFLAGDILPESIYDLSLMPFSNPEGMVYSSQLGLWVDIYLQSGTGTSTMSAFGTTITDTRDWMDFSDDQAAVGKRLLRDAEFAVAAFGSNEKTNIAGSADPVTVGGYLDTAGRRMISNIGCEGMCGQMYQWLDEQSYQNDSATYAGTFSWQTLGGNRGSMYKQGAIGDVKLLAGGYWNSGTACGSRFRYANHARWNTYSNRGARSCARSRKA